MLWRERTNSIFVYTGIFLSTQVTLSIIKFSNLPHTFLISFAFAAPSGVIKSSDVV